MEEGKPPCSVGNHSTVCCPTSSEVTTLTALSEGEKKAKGRGESLLFHSLSSLPVITAIQITAASKGLHGSGYCPVNCKCDCRHSSKAFTSFMTGGCVIMQRLVAS